MEVEGLLYEALSPISLSTSGHPPPPPALDSEPYQVFRNEISLSAVESHSPTAAAPDYFSLHLDADDETTVDLIPVSSRYLISATLSHQLQKSKHQEMLQYVVYLKLSNIYGPTAR